MRMEGMGEILLRSAGRGGSLITRSLRTERGSVPLWPPSLAWQSVRSSSEFYSKLALGSGKPHPMWNRGPPWTRSPNSLASGSFLSAAGPGAPLLSPRDPFPPRWGQVQTQLTAEEVGRPGPSLLDLGAWLWPGAQGPLREKPAVSSPERRPGCLSAARLHIVPWEESCPLRADTLTPAVGVAAGDADDSALREGELVVLLASVWVQRHHCKARG